jgi:hypothetical protein
MAWLDAIRLAFPSVWTLYSRDSPKCSAEPLRWEPAVQLGSMGIVRRMAWSFCAVRAYESIWKQMREDGHGTAPSVPGRPAASRHA